MRINRREPWQDALAQSSLSALELLDLLQLPADMVAASDHGFPLRVPRSFIDRMIPGDPDDPLLLQVLPRAEEGLQPIGFVADPLEESRFSPIPGLLHKYQSRVLLMVSGGCAIHCRYCFRRHFPYDEHAISQSAWQKIYAYLMEHTEVNEVILSGGDPLMLKDGPLAGLFRQIKQIPHIRRLRIHTRIPVVLPERMTKNLWRTLDDAGLPVVLVLHANHAQELNEEVASALAPAREYKVTLLNQAVLLAGVNDQADALCDLSEQLFRAGVLPYYLHALDPVKGTAHFHVSDERAIALMQEVLARLPGYLVPKLVREEAGKAHKSPLHI